MRQLARIIVVGVLALTASACRSPFDNLITHHKLPSYIKGAYWTHPPEGYRIVVDPTLFGRNHASDNPPRALAEALADAKPAPFHMTPKIRDSLTKQMRCHAEFAQTKDRWDLEQWRPDISYDGFIAAFCNPGKP
jgi:hypothetical protein